MSLPEGLNLGEDFNILSALGANAGSSGGPEQEVAQLQGRGVHALSSGSGESGLDHQKAASVFEKICKSIAEVNKIQFRGLESGLADKHQVRMAIREQGNHLRHLKHLLRAKDQGELQQLAERIREVYAEDNLTAEEAQEVAAKLQKINLKLPPTSAKLFLNGVLTPSRVLYAAVVEVISGILAGFLGTLWKANLDPANPIKDPNRPPVLRVHGLMDTQGSSLPLWAMMKARRSLRNRMGKDHIKYGSSYSLSYAGLFYNNPKQSVDDYVAAVADKVISIRRQTGHKQIIMQGHSLGGLIINRFAELQDALKELKTIADPEEREEKAKAMRKELMIEPKIHADILELATLYNASQKKKERAVQQLASKIQAKGFNVENAESRMRALLEENDPEKRREMATSLADDAADAWWDVLRDKIDPDHEDENKRSMEAKWLISICTPYGGSKFATGLTEFQKMAHLPVPRIIESLRKHSQMTEIIGSDARKKVTLGKRKVYNIACKNTDEFVSEGSATINYDYRYTKVFDDLAHVGVLFSPRVASSIGSWLDDIYREIGELDEEEKALL